MTDIDKTALSYWFPIVRDAGLPVPKTTILEMPENAREAIYGAFDGKKAGDIQPFAAQIAAAAKEVGFPAFLRTDHTSGKHSWNETCFLTSEENVPRHIFSLAEFSECCDFKGLPYQRWIVREFLPTIPFGKCPGFGDMPICREFRFFVTDSKVDCWHPYWPHHALEQGGAVYTDDDFDFERFSSPDSLSELAGIASRAGAALGGSWSVDLLETQRGWFLTDMAEARKSFHWEGCAVHEANNSDAVSG